MKEKILAELERLKREWSLGNSAEAKYRVEAYTEIIELLNSLPEEPVSEDLDTAANEAWIKAEDKESYADTFIDGFKAGAQWQKEHGEGE